VFKCPECGESFGGRIITFLAVPCAKRADTGGKAMGPKLNCAIGINCFHSGYPFFAFGADGRPRFDLGFYRTEDEVEALIETLRQVDRENCY